MPKSGSPILLVIGVLAAIASFVGTAAALGLPPWSGIAAFAVVVAAVVVLHSLAKTAYNLLLTQRAKVPPSLLLPNEIRASSFGTSTLSAGQRDALNEVKLAALKLLFLDRLDTGGWATTYFWRVIQHKDVVPALCTLTGTHFVLEALPTAAKMEIPKLTLFAGLLESLLSSNGRYFRFSRLTSHGSIDEHENLRHTSAGLLLRASFWGTNEKDMATLRWLLSETKDLDSEQVEYLDLSYCLRALMLARTKLRLKSATEYRAVQNAVDRVFSHMRTAVAGGHDVRLLWGPRGAAAPIGNALFQWAAVWNVLPYLQECWRHRVHRSAVYEVTGAIRALIAQSLSHRPSATELLPAEYSGSKQLRPTGQSVFATAMALAVSRCLQYLKPESDSFDLDRINRELVEKVCTIGLPMVTEYALQLNGERPEALEGYLAWASIVLVCKTLGIEVSSAELRWAARRQSDPSVPGAAVGERFLKCVNEAAEALNSMLNGCTIALDKHRYYTTRLGTNDNSAR